MPNLFSALSHSNADTLANHLALLENVTTSCALAPYAQKAGRAAARTVNWAASAFRETPVLPEPDVVELKERVLESFSAHRTEVSEGLLAKIRTQCCARLSVSGTESDSSVSVKLIHEAAQLYGIDDWLTPAEQAEAVSNRFQEEALSNLRKAVSKMSVQERSGLERQISADLQNLSPEEREKIQRDMKLDELSGEALTTALIAAGGPFASIGALSAAGFGAYLALTTIIHAVATTLLGITLPFAAYTTATSALSLLTGPIGWALVPLVIIIRWRSSERKLSRTLFAGLVATGSQSPDFFKPSDSIAPSGTLNSTKVDQTARAADLLEQEKYRAEANLDVVARKLAKETDELERAHAGRKRAEEAADTYRSKLAESAARSEREITRLKQALAQAAHSALAEMSKSEEHQCEIRRLSDDNERLRQVVEEARIRQSSFEDGEGKKLLDLWTIHFPRMTFEPKAVRWAVHKNHRERISLERKLKELHDCDDPAALSRGKMREAGDHHLKFRLETVECRMFYRLANERIVITNLGTNAQCHR